MADPRLAGSKQPYHEVEGLAPAEAARRLARLSDSAARLAREGLGRMVEDLRRRGLAPRAAGILDSSGRKGASLEAILASHALIHTADGEHFRAALDGAISACGLEVTRVRERDVLARAEAALGRPAIPIQAEVLALGRPLGPPWGADQKKAAMLAWILLAGGAGGRRGARRSAR